jgi:hypothetical protein
MLLAFLFHLNNYNKYYLSNDILHYAGKLGAFLEPLLKKILWDGYLKIIEKK